jgi:hypothetical protein
MLGNLAVPECLSLILTTILHRTAMDTPTVNAIEHNLSQRLHGNTVKDNTQTTLRNHG